MLVKNTGSLKKSSKKRSTSAKRVARKAPSVGIIKKDKKMLGKVVKGTASGGAVKGAFEAGDKAVGITSKKGDSPKKNEIKNSKSKNKKK